MLQKSTQKDGKTRRRKLDPFLVIELDAKIILSDRDNDKCKNNIKITSFIRSVSTRDYNKKYLDKVKLFAEKYHMA